MDHVTSFLDHIARLEAQNRLETDPDLKRENKATIRELHKQARKAAKHHQPWHGLLRNVVWLFLLFFIAVFVLLKLIGTFGWMGTLGASFVALIAMTLITSKILLITGHIDQDTYRNLVKDCLKTLADWILGKKTDESAKNEPEVPKKSDQPNRVASRAIFAETSRPDEKPPE